jgi:hypothetical protein
MIVGIFLHSMWMQTVTDSAAADFMPISAEIVFVRLFLFSPIKLI